MSKRDFWDDSYEEKKMSKRKRRKEQKHIIEDTQMVVVDNKFHPTRSTGFKAFIKVIMFLSAMAAALCLYIGYRYFDDRMVNKVHSSSYFDSKSFSTEFNTKTEQLIKLLGAVEQNEDVLKEENQMDLASLEESYMGAAKSNFSYAVYNAADSSLVLKSGEDSVERIESSKHYIKISTKNDDFGVTSSVRGNTLDQANWKKELSALNNDYVIYQAVDNSLTVQDGFYDSYMSFNRIANWYSIAKFAIIGALALLLLCLIFSTIAAGRTKDSGIVKLNWFDRIFTEFGFIIILALLGGIIFGVYLCYKNGFAYRRYVLAAGAVLGTLVAGGGYFSLVRRIKSGEFIDNSILYMIGSRINAGLNHLPSVLKYILIILFLVALNGGLIWMQMKFTEPRLWGIPIIFIISGVVFFIEFIVFLSCLFMKDRPEVAEEEPAEQEPDEMESIEDYFEIEKNVREVDAIGDAAVEPSEDLAMIGDAYEAVGPSAGDDTAENVVTNVPDNTVMLSPEEAQKLTETEAAKAEAAEEEKPAAPEFDDPVIAAVAAAEAAPEPVKTIDMVEITKSVRRELVDDIKAKEVTVALRSPGKAVETDMTETDARDFVRSVLSSVIKYTKRGGKSFVEVYTQNMYKLYIAKIAMDPEDRESADRDMAFDLEQASHIVEKYNGRFVSEVSDEQCRIGVLFR